MINTPFPQANDLGKILILIDSFNYCTESQLLSKLKLNTKRQLDYYKSASLFLGFFRKNKRYSLSKSGLRVSGTNTTYKKEIFIIELLRTKILRKIVFNYNENKIEEILNEFNSFKSLSASTKKRRISTIKNWVKWLNTNIEK